MVKRTAPYPAESRRKLNDLVRSRRMPEELGKQFEPRRRPSGGSPTRSVTKVAARTEPNA